MCAVENSVEWAIGVMICMFFFGQSSTLMHAVHVHSTQSMCNMLSRVAFWFALLNAAAVA